MAKEIVKKIKLQIPAGQATPAPPVGTILGPAGINLQEFCQKFNEASQDKRGDVLPVEITLYEDRSYDFVLKTPPAAFLLKKAAKIDKASKKGANEVAAIIEKADLQKIAETKMTDLNAYDVESAMNIIEGTARNMGIAIKGVNDEELAAQAAEAAELEKEMAKREAELAEMEASLAEANVDVEVIGEEETAEGEEVTEEQETSTEEPVEEEKTEEKSE